MARRWWLGAALAACLAWTAQAQAQPFVYVANGSAGSMSQYDAMGGALSPLVPATVAAGMSPHGLAVSPDGKSVYVTDSAVLSGTILQFDVGPGGVLSPKTPATVAAGTGTGGIVVSPDARSVYVLTDNPGPTVSQYDVGADGTLTPKAPPTVPTGSAGFGPDPLGIAVSPDGGNVYVTNAADSTVSQYDVGPGGVLSPKTPATVPAGNQANGVVVSPDSKSVYVTNTGDGTVSQFDVGAGGSLTPKTPATVATGGAPEGVAVSPDGKSVYLTNDLHIGTVSQYDIGAGGALSPKTTATVSAGSGPVDVVVNPDGKSVYVTTDNEAFTGVVFQYDVGPGGALTPKMPATVPMGGGPSGIAVSPLQTLPATATSVSCSPSVFAPGDATVCKATVTDTAGAGKSTPTGKVSFTNSGAGGFFGNPCTLSGGGPSASCAVFFTAFPRGGRIIAAGYGGDATHSSSSAITGVTVAPPESTGGCVVFAHGRITATNGDKASFRGLVAATPPRGVELYRDNGPADALRLVSTSVDALTCTDDAIKASVFGTAKINGGGSVAYRIDVQLTAWERGKDTYRIRLSNGYDSGAQQIRHGDADIHIHSSEHHHHDANAGHHKHSAGQDGRE